MGSVNSRSGNLFLDFRYKGVRCREYTKLEDSPGNRRRLKKILEHIEAEIILGTFDYSKYFPNSPRATQFAERERKIAAAQSETVAFYEFAELWFEEMAVQWRNSHRKNMRVTLDKYLLPAFGANQVDEITKADILGFRAQLTRQPGLSGNKSLSASRINHIMTPLRMIVNEAADRYEFVTPYRNISPLKVPRTDIEPFDLEEVQQILQTVRPDYRNYYLVRFFTGMRTGEVDGLQWQYVDFKRRQILIRKALVDGELVETKTAGSFRAIDMSAPVFDALRSQQQATGKQQFVFCNSQGGRLMHRLVTERVWYPLLRHLNMQKRRPYQTRHTAATLWLAAGENPEWIARQMGHSSTEMLFRVYSRYVPNLTRRDGSAFEQLLQQQFNQQEISDDTD